MDQRWCKCTREGTARGRIPIIIVASVALLVVAAGIGLAVTHRGHSSGGGGGGQACPPYKPPADLAQEYATQDLLDALPRRPATVERLSWDEAERLADRMLARMEPCEKYALMQGIGWDNNSVPWRGYYIGGTASIKRLGIPSLNMNDAAGGFRTIFTELVGTATCWPSLLAAAATWSEAGVQRLGVALGQEFGAKGANGILGPSINVHRTAYGGRNFEYLSGEDPFLGSRLTAAYVTGVESQGVFTVMKHFVLNNQETNRNSESSVAEQKTKWELYYPPFQAAVEAGVSAAMCSYNKVDGDYSCSNEETLADLKVKMGFRGPVMSDWWATHSTSVGLGLDMDMPGAPTESFFSPESLAKQKPADVDASVKRILSVMYRARLFDTRQCTPPFCSGNYWANVTSEEHTRLARELAAESIVLLKNNGGALPLGKEKAKTLAIVGAASVSQPYNPANGTWNRGDYYSGGGSGHVTAGSVVTPLDGIRAKATELGIQVRVSSSNDESAARKAAADADITIVVAATTSGEGQDRQNLSLDGGADDLVTAVAGVASTVVVLCQAPGAVLMPWRDLASVQAIAILFLGGQETGSAWADVLFGDRPPEGRLPIMLPETEKDAIAPGKGSEVVYTEGLATSYRSRKFKAAFPFGHGLTYASFAYGKASCRQCAPTDGSWASSLCVDFSLTNNGPMAARAVPQLYLEFPAAAKQPAPLLKGFVKTDPIEPAATLQVTLSLTDRDRSYYDSGKSDWVVADGTKARIGESSADLRQVVDLSGCGRPGRSSREAVGPTVVA